MKKIFLILILLIFIIPAYALSTKEIMREIPELNNVSCTFKQHRYLPDRDLVSGGNFEFIRDKGVVFYTTYPVKMTTSYTSAQNKQINEVIIAMSKKDYTYLEKNFKLNFMKLENNSWKLVLIPVNNSIKSHLKSISIDGNKNINKILIETVNNGKTDISFSCGK